MDNRVTTIYAPQYNAVLVRGFEVQSLREKPESWEDPTHPDYIGRRLEYKLDDFSIATQEAADAKAEEILAAVSCRIVERTGDWDVS